MYGTRIKARKAAIAIVMTIISVTGIMAQDLEKATESERLVNIGDAFIQAGNTEKAVDLYKDALETANDAEEMWIAADRLAKISCEQGNSQRALSYFDMIMNNKKVAEDSTIMMNIYGQIGQIYYQMKDYIKAMKSYEKAKKYLPGSPDRTQKAILNSKMAKTLIVAGDIKEAEKLLDKAETTCEEANMIEESSEIYATKSELYVICKDYEKALEYKTKQCEVDQIVWQKAKKELEAAHTPWSNYQKNELNQLTDNKLKEAEKKLEENEYEIGMLRVLTTITSILLIIVIFIAGYLMHYSQKNKRRINQITSEDIEKKKILATIAQDFVNPFNALMGFAELQMQYAQAQDDREMFDYSRTIYNSAQALFQMVGNILAWSSSDNKMSAKRKNMNVASEIENVVSVYRLMAEEKGVTINVSIEDDIQINADENHFNIMLRNIISNALKYTPKGGKINISALNYEGKTSIIVDDSGVGMSKENVKKINNHQVIKSTSGTQDEKGIGLGLAICGDLVRANRGSFEVSSEEGKGTTVTLIFDNKA